MHWLWWQPCKLYLSTWTVYQEQSDLCLHSNMYFGFLVEDTPCCKHAVCQIRGMCVKSSSLFPLRETQAKTLRHVSPSKQLCLAIRASWQLCCCTGLHSSSRKNSSFWDSNPVPKRRVRAGNPLNQPDNTEANFSQAQQAGYLPSAVKICHGSSSPAASLRIQNPSPVSHPLPQHSPHLVHLLKPFHTTLLMTKQEARNSRAQALLLLSCSPRDRQAERTGHSALSHWGLIFLADGWHFKHMGHDYFTTGKISVKAC